MGIKDIRLKIMGAHVDRKNGVVDDEDVMEFITDAKAFYKDGVTYFSYDESEMLGTEGVTASLAITDEGVVTMERTSNGVVIMDSTMKFIPGKRYETLYHAPFGTTPMEVLTNVIVTDFQGGELSGSLFIDYNVSLKGIGEARHAISVETEEVFASEEDYRRKFKEEVERLMRRDEEDDDD